MFSRAPGAVSNQPESLYAQERPPFAASDMTPEKAVPTAADSNRTVTAPSVNSAYDMTRIFLTATPATRVLSPDVAPEMAAYLAARNGAGTHMLLQAAFRRVLWDSGWARGSRSRGKCR